MFASVYAAKGSPSHVLLEVARDFSPRVEACGLREVTLDLSGLARLFGEAQTIAAELRRTAADRGLLVRVAIAGTRTAARLLAHHRAGITVIEPGTEAAALAPLPLALLAHLSNDPNAKNDPNDSNVKNAPNAPNDSHDLLSTVRRWGLKSLGDLAALPPDAVAARLGQAGVDWQRLARGEDRRPLVPAVPEERFEQALDLEWPIEGLEPLSFVLGRLMEPLSAHLERRDRGAAVLHVRLHLVKRDSTGDGVTREVHERSLELPAPIRDARTLRTLALLDLESHPPSAAIDRVVVAIDPTPGRVVQFSLLTRPLPSPEQLSTLMARLHALMGEGRCGAAVAVDSWEPGAFGMRAFAPADAGIRDRELGIGRLATSDQSPTPNPQSPVVAIRRFRFPVPARVRVDRGVPVRVIIDRRGWSGGHVEAHAGPWRTSGGWWIEASDAHKEGLARRSSPKASEGWERDEWDVTLSDGATYRVFRQRDTDAWFIEGVVD
jgi:protein ImuB